MRIVLTILFMFVPVLVAAGQSPIEVERGLLRHLKDVSKYGTYAGSYDDKKSAAANRQVRNELIRNGNRPAILKYAFPKLKGEMFITTSNDGKLRIYSWDMETGGTMHDYASVFQYQGKSGKVYTWSETGDEESAGPFYTQIFQVPTKTNTIYLINSTFIASSSLSGQSLDAVRILGEKLDRKARLIRTSSGLTHTVGFAYDFFSVVDRPERPIKLFFFDEAKREFRFPVVIEDDDVPQGRVTDKYIHYRFNGTHFVKVK